MNTGREEYEDGKIARRMDKQTDRQAGRPAGGCSIQSEATHFSKFTLCPQI